MDKQFIIEQKDFRAYYPERVQDKNGNFIWIQVCEELVAGKWEGFISLPSKKRVENYMKLSV